jgi:PAS domain S-box-containing protein
MLDKNKEFMRAKAQEVLNKKMPIQKDLSPEESKSLLYELQVHQIELEMQNDELRKVEIELRDSKKHYFDLYNITPLGYFTLDEKDIIVEANLTLSKMLGVTRNSLIKQPFKNFIMSEDQDIYYLYRKKDFDSDEPQECELRMKRTDGTSFWANISSTVVKNSDKTMTLNSVLSDISRRKRMEEELREQERVMMIETRQNASRETLMMLAHQWQQPLSIIGMATDNLRAKLELEGKVEIEELNECISQVSTIVQELSQAIDDFKNLFTPDMPKELTTMSDILEGTVKVMCELFWKNDIRLEMQNNVKSTLHTYKNQLIQVLISILENAKEAFLVKEIKDGLIHITANKIDRQITINICDNAGGINESMMKKMGHLFISSKERHNGVGLGLYSSQTIIEKYFNGTITWKNEKDGACFTIVINLEDERYIA